MSQSAAGQDFTETQSSNTVFVAHREVQIVSHVKTYTQHTVEISSFERGNREPPSGDSESLDSEVARLAPALRWKFISKNDPGTLMISLLLLIATAYAAVKAFSMLGITLIVGLVGAASAASGASVSESHDPSFTEPVILLLVTLFSIWSLATISLSKSATNVTFAKDIGKMILGFLVGFFGGSRGR